jgi:tetratricopeptide (TPR) repeat protein
VLQDLGKYRESEEMNRQALEGRERVLRNNHPDTLISIRGLASVLQYQEKYEEAEKMYRRALEGGGKDVGERASRHADQLGQTGLDTSEAEQVRGGRGDESTSAGMD